MSGMTIDRLSGNGPYTPGAKAVNAQDFLLLMEGQEVTLPDGTTVGPADGPFFIGLTQAPSVERVDATVADETDDRMISTDVKGLLTRFVEMLEKVRVPVVHVDVAPANIHFHAPEQAAPIVNLTLPESGSAPTPNIIVQPAPVTVVQSPMAKLLRRRGIHRLTRDGPNGVVTGNVVEEEYEYEGDGDVREGQ